MGLSLLFAARAAWHVASSLGNAPITTGALNEMTGKAF